MAKKRKDPYTGKILDQIENEKDLAHYKKELAAMKKELSAIITDMAEAYYRETPVWKEHVDRYNRIQYLHVFIEAYPVFIEMFEAKKLAGKIELKNR